MAFFKTVDRRSRKAMTSFLSNHFRYYTQNSWNLTTSFANNVKLYNLGLTETQTDKAYEIISDVFDEFWETRIEPLVYMFEETTGYTIGMNGRSSGYIVLYDKAHPSAPIQPHTDYDAYSMNDLKTLTELVCEFDKLCDNIIDAFIDTVNNANIYSETINIPKTIKHLSFEDYR